jgi:uncharacterized 2Fe-2S/4Fe-4S cluster protein (DUF4445 family)
MSIIRAEIMRPGGQSRHVTLEDPSGERTLADLLEENGFPLNKRCGGRGLCKGCQVELNPNHESQTVRSCQRRLKDLPQAIERIRIPENSWRDHSLHGVSVFEIHTDSTLATGQAGYGVALDIGTTTVAGALWNLENGHCVAHESRANSQARYGDNVLSRISYAIDNLEGVKDLQAVLLKDCLKPILTSLCDGAGIRNEEITTVTVSGNPAMLHAFAGESLTGFGSYPFSPVFLGEKFIQADVIGLPVSCDVRLLPSLGAFVGADIAVGALASGMLQADAPILLIDFGTNGEILLKHNGGFMATATAAGPAFEGGRLNCGAAARGGVISSFQFDENTWKWRLSGNEAGPPAGISGAAYVDFMALGCEMDLLDLFGRIDRNHPDAMKRTEGEDTDWCVAFTDDIFISESDVAELLQAKAAIEGGVATLLEQAGIIPEDLKLVLVAGGFGYHLNPRNAVRIGLLPDVPLDRIRMVGNASLGGASLLLNPDQNSSLRELVDKCEVIELNQIDSFEDHFTDSLTLEEADF